MYAYVTLYAPHVCRSPQKLEDSIGSLELELWVVVIHLEGVEAQPKLSAGTVSTLRQLAISLAPKTYFKSQVSGVKNKNQTKTTYLNKVLVFFFPYLMEGFWYHQHWSGRKSTIRFPSFCLSVSAPPSVRATTRLSDGHKTAARLQ